MVKEKEKLVWLGIKRASQQQSEVTKEIEKLKKNVGDYDTFQAHLDAYDLDGDSTDEDISNFSQFKTYLQDHGFSADEADTFIEKIKNNFEDVGGDGSKYDDFEDFVQNDSDTYTELKSAFNSQPSYASELETPDGEPAAGVRTFDRDGVSYDGVTVPAGGIEMWGVEVHFSETEVVKSNTGSGSTGSGSTFSVSNFQTDDADDEVELNQSLTFSADITNNGDYTEFYVATLTEDGTAIRSENMQIGPGNTKTVEFTVTKDEYLCADYKIDTAGPITACWIPSNL